MTHLSLEPPVIPYNFSDLEPVLSRDSLVFHFLRHQRVCHDRLRLLIGDSTLAQLDLTQIVRLTAHDPAQHEIFRWAAEAWNHTLYWQSMRPRGGGAPHGAVAEQIRRCFDSYERFAREFRELASSHFGSGWLWLVWRGDALALLTTCNAANPLTSGDVPLLALDLWEHAYYLDFQNRRAAYVSAFLEDLVNWECANRALAAPDGTGVRAPLRVPPLRLPQPARARF